MTVDELVATYPRLWHMAMDGSWTSIQEHGLLSTSALLDLYGYEGAKRRAIELTRRPSSVAIAAPGLPGAIVRDQIPMSDSALQKCLLDELKPVDWYRTLNSQCFFWLSRKRLRRLLGARAYRKDPQVVLTLDTAGLVEKHQASILLSPINSGSTIMKPVERGRKTFLPIADYPFDDWKTKRGKSDAVVELVVVGGVPDIRDYVIAVHRVEQANPTELWRRPGSSLDDGP
ncbi:hypothetical protein [Methylobacterium sp. Leaf89]|uniref:DUF7002 family protein n=1 Tax=Methylobacterium sp. Leaf89 TaxID=1736245 RepID=UPI0006F245E6|nr:hypothetical protein [Methylobacterium sp. Leaf89]KQO69232.1 hypothetical protein ASF18_01980 [Methylobacterium sp. Leaf89]